MQSNNRDLLIGMVIGVAIGGALAVLFAPMRGEETRHKLRDVTSQTREKTKELVEKGREYIQLTQRQLQEAIEAGKQAAREKRYELEAEMRERMERVPAGTA